MTIPKDVKVGGHTIKTVSKDRVITDDDGYVYGAWRGDDLEIDISTELQPSQLAETFLHEVLHALSDDRGMELSEEQVTALGSGMIALFVDNPKIFGTHYMESFVK